MLQEETPPQPNHLHYLPAARAGASLRKVPLSGCLLAGGTGDESEPTGGSSTGECATLTDIDFFL